MAAFRATHSQTDNLHKRAVAAPNAQAHQNTCEEHTTDMLSNINVRPAATRYETYTTICTRVTRALHALAP